MTIVCDPICWGTEHVSFNAGVLEITAGAYPSDPIVFFGESSHIACLRNQLGVERAGRIAWRPVPISARYAGYFARLRSELFLFGEIFRSLPEAGNGHRLVLLSSMPSTLLALKLSRRQSAASPAVQLFLHGGLSGVSQTRSLRPTRRIRDMATAIRLFGKQGILYFVLERNIRELVLERLPFLADRVEVLEHPLTPNEIAPEMATLAYPIRFGYLGLANQPKGFPLFLQLAAEMKKDGIAEFHALGKLARNMHPTDGLAALASRPGGEHLDRAAYVSGIQQLHFAIFPYSENHYASSPSGTLLDAIVWGKPIIAKRIPLFEGLFTRYGNIGYLFSTTSELKQIIAAIVEHPDTILYRLQVSNLRKIQQERTPGSLAATYRRICARQPGLPGPADPRIIEKARLS